MTNTKTEWQRDYVGRYISRLSGWAIERSVTDYDSKRGGYDGKWLVINPETDRVADSFSTLREAKKHYSKIQETK
jgi:hypothetical protein